ncbi:MAG: ferritin-like domain-containing protein [Acetobacteraceae bacterium]|nr:ferritin-like domain-containing protein [Acetobacteraceae bacterium]
MKSMKDLMLHFLQDIYYAERQGLRGMAKMAKAVESEQLKQAILEHRDQSQKQISRLEQVFEAIGKRPRGKTCAAMDGLAEEADEAVEEGEKGPVLDAGLIACAQAVEHYEIARYGAMVAWARQLGMDEAAELLQQTLEEEKQSDQRLNEIAEGAMNQQAAESGAEDEEAGEEEGGEEAGGGRGRGGTRRRAAATRAKAPEKPARGRAASAGAGAKKPATRRSSSRK